LENGKLYTIDNNYFYHLLLKILSKS